MIPTNTPNKQSCPDGYTSAQCIFWQGPDLDCIDVCNGDRVSDIIAKLATLLCEINEKLDLSGTDLKCLISDCINCPEPEKELGTILQGLINKVCESGETITSTPDGEAIITVPACLPKPKDEDDIDLPSLPLSEYVRWLSRTVICDLRTRLTTVENKVTNHEDRITDLEDATALTLPKVTSDCLPGFDIAGEDIDDAFEILDSEFCDFTTKVGRSGIGTAIAQQCSLDPLKTLDYTIMNNPAYVASPTTLTASMKNMWIAMCAIKNQINTLMETCCAVTCDDIKIGFGVDSDEERDNITLMFTYGFGTVIPAGFTDCGSKLTITDTSGNFQMFNITIENDAEINLQIFSLLKNVDWTFKLEYCLGSTGLKCQKTLTKTITYNDLCSICEITADGQNHLGTATGSVTVLYKDSAISTTIKTLTIKIGETGILKKSAVIVSIIENGDASALSECDLPDAEEMVCGVIYYATDDNTGSSGPFATQTNDTNITGISINGAVYSFASNVVPTNYTALQNAINSVVPTGLLQSVLGVNIGSTADRIQHKLTFKAPQISITSIYLTFAVSDFGNVRVYAQEIECPAS